ncbi:hypothetical protein PsYK624_153160 [Phanerochaete sordida]|uniref:Heterokaryon incompatibility domain-containing protein n=1 Tax=Phanerochaete sordida TaxID=48140 RepID=A0A9P3GT16_9APHY|nr:hypothetical protein PsYK624_153160 [Phanerochaete sordida]
MPDRVIAIALSVRQDDHMVTDCGYSPPMPLLRSLWSFITGSWDNSDEYSESSTDDPIRVLLSRADIPDHRIPITAERPPWPVDASDLMRYDVMRSSNAEREAAKQMHIDPRTTTPKFRLRSEFRHAAYARMRAWAVVQLLKNGVQADILLRTRGWTNRFAIIPGPLPGQSSDNSVSGVPFQRAHFSPVAIPSGDADKRCSDMSADDLLRRLNSAFGTDYSMVQELQRCLGFLLDALPDFGYAYGVVRPYWRASRSVLFQLPERLYVQEEEVRAMRREAVRENYLSNVKIPPRRVWDLHSNRVLPYHVLPAAPTGLFPYNFWTVSHSWVDDNARAPIITPINAGAWPVPIPRDTTLDHVRVELLNFGAEYVWLDVLCLRQAGRAEDESQRRREWKLDIPTIGFIYSLPEVPCVTYFNGLGLPFDPSDSALSSRRHWLKRVWTVQETTDNWLPGGMTASSSARARAFFHEHHMRSILPTFDPLAGKPSTLVLRLARAVKELSARHCTSELDRVSSLAYILGCKTRPLYDAAISADRAWAILLKHLPGIVRAQIALRSMQCGPERREVLPAWQEFLGDFAIWEVDAAVLRRVGDQYTPLRLVDPSCLGAVEPGVYYEDVHLVGPLTVHSEEHFDGARAVHATVKEQDFFRFRWDTRLRFKNVVGGPFDSDAMYMLRQTRLKVTIILQVLGKRAIDGCTTFVVVRHGAILDDYDQASFSYSPLVRIMYQS